MSEGSEDDNFDAYREDIQSIKSIEHKHTKNKSKAVPIKSKVHLNYYSKLNSLNKALRDKLKQLNERLERVLDKVYIKSLNPNKTTAPEIDSSYLLHIADKELENAKSQFEQFSQEKDRLDNEINSINNPKAVIELDATIKQLKDYKRDLNKEISELKYVKLSQGKHLKKLVDEPKELNETDALIYKLKVLKKKEEALKQEVDTKKSVIDSLKSRILDSKAKSESEAKVVQNAERKSSLHTSDKPSAQVNKQSLEQEYRNTINSISINSDSTKESKILADLKKETKAKKFELDKLLIELHERDKENRLLNLKVKDLERIVPQTKLNPMSRDNSEAHLKNKSNLK